MSGLWCPHLDQSRPLRRSSRWYARCLSCLLQLNTQHRYQCRRRISPIPAHLLGLISTQIRHNRQQVRERWFLHLDQSRPLRRSSRWCTHFLSCQPPPNLPSRLGCCRKTLPTPSHQLHSTLTRIHRHRRLLSGLWCQHPGQSRLWY